MSPVDQTPLFFSMLAAAVSVLAIVLFAMTGKKHLRDAERFYEIVSRSLDKMKKDINDTMEKSGPYRDLKASSSDHYFYLAICYQQFTRTIQQIDAMSDELTAWKKMKDIDLFSRESGRSQSK